MWINQTIKNQNNERLFKRTLFSWKLSPLVDTTNIYLNNRNRISLNLYKFLLISATFRITFINFGLTLSVLSFGNGKLIVAYLHGEK